MFLLDRASKSLAVHHLSTRAPIVLIPHVLDLSYTTNSGGAFGLLGSAPWLFFTASVVVIVVIVAVSTRVSSLPMAIGLGLILGGAFGNVTDRLSRGTGVSGRVVDFIHLHNWPVFNVADSSIVIGTLIVVLAGAMRPSGSSEEAEPKDPKPGAAGE